MLDRLRDILLREQERGCDDRTVMGGLEALVGRWRGSLAATVDEGEAARKLTTALDLLDGYGQAAPTERARRISEALTLLPKQTSQGLRRREAAPEMATRRRPPAPVSAPPKPSFVRTSASPEAPATPSTPQRTTRAGRGSVSKSSESTSLPKVVRTGGLDADVRNLWGISDVYALRLRKLGIATIRDLLYHFPHRHVDYSVVKPIRELSAGEVETVVGTIWEVRNNRARSGMTVTSAVVADDTGTVQAIWFNQPFLAKTLSAGQRVVLSGRITENLGTLQLKSPDWEVYAGHDTVHTGRLVPVYPLTDGITDRWMRATMKRAVDTWAKKLPDHLPDSIRRQVGLLPLSTAVSQMHFPYNEEHLAQATRRLAFDEFFIMQLAVLTRRRDWQHEAGNAMKVEPEVVDGFLATLPFSLTAAQRRVLDEIGADMAKPQPMSRLLQGDVGSGKTVVATTATVVAAHNGFQSVIMAPTEILAEQHFRTISSLLKAEPVGDDLPGVVAGRPLPGFGDGVLTVALLTGSVKKSVKEALYEAIAKGRVDIVIGTHAVIQEDVTFWRLGMVVVDEQHRFGVNQRAALRQKGYNPDLLVMTATPIPRTLALTLYGDLDLSVIDELPPGRQEIKTAWLGPDDRDQSYEFVRRQVRNGRQAFIICPLVEESDKIEAKAAVAEHERLQREVFPDLRLGLLHGRMKGQEKEKVMVAFRDGELDVLISTAVVEVGIDVPNATVMLIEGADRFGLSQLHQFRGRVGRGSEKSFCLLLADSPSYIAEQRLMAITHTQNGFALAEEDLRLRGPGEFFGTRQSGLPDLKVAHYSDLETLQEARSVAEELFKDDPFLKEPELRPLRERVERFLAAGLDIN